MVGSSNTFCLRGMCQLSGVVHLMYFQLVDVLTGKEGQIMSNSN